MEHKDAAFKAFCEFADTVKPEYWENIHTEADIRMKIIDKVFLVVLGWPEDEISLESEAGGGFIDYRLTVGGLSRLIVEAKKEARDLGLSNDYKGRSFKLSGSVFKTEASQEGIKQAISYCGYKNAELACVTNGRQWFVFRGNRVGDGKDTLEGLAFCFGSLDSIKEKFSLFYDLLAYQTVSRFTYRGLFQEAEGQPMRSRIFRAPVRELESRNYLTSDKLSADVDRIMLSFFQDINGDDDPEARKECFVSTDESHKAEQDLIRISDELRGAVRSIDADEGAEITAAIKRVKAMKRKELVLLVGTKGAGKTTFVDRFFSDILPKDLANDCVIVRIDLADCGGNVDTILSWLNEHFLAAAEKAAFDGQFPTYDDLMGMYFGQYQRWRDGTHKHLYDTDKNQFKIKFGEYVERRRENQPQEYITCLLNRIVAGHIKVPCLVFDNADHFDVRFQEEVFKYAHALYRESLCMAILPITDTTSWQLTKEGPMQSFYSESLYLPTPPTELILRKRIEYIENKTKSDKPERGIGYFLARGIPLEITNIKAFTACLQKVFLETPNVALWIGRLANQDIRRSLKLTREIIGSPHIKVAELLKSYLQKSAIDVDSENIKLAMIKGKYDIYSGNTNHFVQNIYNLNPSAETSPLLAVRLLGFLNDRWQQNKDNDARYVTVESICSYFHESGLEAHITIECLGQMLKYGLVLSYNPLIVTIERTTRLEISPSGRQHLTWAQTDWIYLEAMAFVTPLMDQQLNERLLTLTASDLPHHRRQVVEEFLSYLLKEDYIYCKIPDHDQYKRQIQIGEVLQQQLRLTRAPETIGENTRFTRTIGTIKSWNDEKGFGFIITSIGGIEPFMHINDVINKEALRAKAEGQKVEYDTVSAPKGIKAVNVLVLNN